MMCLQTSNAHVHPLRDESSKMHPQPKIIACDDKRFAYKTYKLTTADTSQVCDGRAFARKSDEKKDNACTSSIVRKPIEGSAAIDDTVHADQGASTSSISSNPSANSRIGLDALRQITGYLPLSTRRSSLEVSVDDLSKLNDLTREAAAESKSKSANDASSHGYRKMHTYPGTVNCVKDLCRQNPEDLKRAATNDASRHCYKKMNSCPARPRSQLRRKSMPRHRCPTANENVTGIMKPYAKYSRKDSDDGCLGLPGLRRASTGSTSSATSSWSNFDIPHQRRGSLSSRPGRTSSFDTLNSLASTDNMSAKSNETWVPLGVDFSANMEVYVYHEREILQCNSMKHRSYE